MKNLKDDYKNYKYAYQYEGTGKYNIFLYMLEKVQERVSAYKCRKGHRWEVETDIGPDSGAFSRLPASSQPVDFVNNAPEVWR